MSDFLVIVPALEGAQQMEDHFRRGSASLRTLFRVVPQPREDCARPLQYKQCPQEPLALARHTRLCLGTHFA